MTQNFINDRLNECLESIDSNEYRALRECIQDYISDEDVDGEFDSIMELAYSLYHVEAAKDLPKIVFDFIVELYLSEIENGNADAMNDLGALYYDGRGCEQDYAKAVFYYNMAAEKGSRKAQENLGYCYYYGRSVPVDYEKAFHYFALGAFNGYLISLYKIGDMYMRGYYVKRNEREAFDIYNRCMETMTPQAEEYVAGPVLLRLGNCYLNGTGTSVDLEEALVCFQQAEYRLYRMVKNGEWMYRKSLNAAIDGQIRTRERLMKKL